MVNKGLRFNCHILYSIVWGKGLRKSCNASYWKMIGFLLYRLSEKVWVINLKKSLNDYPDVLLKIPNIFWCGYNTLVYIFRFYTMVWVDCWATRLIEYWKVLLTFNWDNVTYALQNHLTTKRFFKDKILSAYWSGMAFSYPGVTSVHSFWCLFYQTGLFGLLE